MDRVLLKDVTADSQNWVVKVRAVRFSDFMNPKDPSRRQRIDVVLLDEEGNSMEGHVPESWTQRFGPQFQEDHVYYIRYFHVLDAKRTFRACYHPYMARFTPYTGVTEVLPVPERFPLLAYLPMTYQEMCSRANNDDVLSDVVAVLVACSPVKEQTTRNGSKPLRKICLNDGSEDIEVALWSRHAIQFDADRYVTGAREGNPTVVLFCAMQCRMFNGRLSLQGTSLCRWYVDPEIPEAHALKTGVAVSLPPPVWLQSPSGGAAAEETDVASLAAIVNPHPLYKKRFVIDAKVKSIVSAEQWWYLGCRVCNRKMNQEGSIYECSSLTCSFKTGSPRYRVAVRAIDPSVPLEDADAPEIDLIFFGAHAEEIIGVPVQDLIASSGGVGSFLPSRIADLCGMIFRLRVSLTRGSLDRLSKEFQVDRVIAVQRCNGQVGSQMASTSAANTAAVSGNKVLEPGPATPAPTTPRPAQVAAEENTPLAGDVYFGCEPCIR